MGLEWLQPKRVLLIVFLQYYYAHRIGTHKKEEAMTTQRLNLAIESELYHSLKQIAAHKNISVTKLINDRLNQSLTLEERLGKKPEWLLKMEEAGLDRFFPDIPLPEPLRWYQDEINHLDSMINLLLKRKDAVQTAFNDEVKSM